MTERQAKRHERVIDEIKTVARQQMAVKGAASLSLGSIARAMGLTTPALYRYFDSRDALVTALILDAYEDLAEETERAITALQTEDLPARFDAVMHTYRRWALAHPQDYVLVHGAVLPGYQAPVERVALAALRTQRIFLDILMDAERAGLLRVPEAFEDLPPTFLDMIAPMIEGDTDASPSVMVTLAFLTWLQIHAMVWQEIAGHLPSSFYEDGRLFEIQISLIAERLGIPRPSAKSPK